jgi:hypothetical protein
MRPIHHFVIAGLAPVLANCSTHPLVDDVTRVNTSGVVQHIRCEAKRAVIDNDLRSKNASGDEISAIAYEFTFQITENNNANGDITWEMPFLNGGGFSLVADAGSERQRFSKRNFRIVDTFDELRKADCSQGTLEKNLIYPIAGEIGIYEVVTTFANLLKAVTPKELTTPAPGFQDPLAGGVFRFADTLKFTTHFGGGVNPSLSLSPVTNSFRVTKVNKGGGPALSPVGLTQVESATPGLQADRDDMHQVVIAMVGFPRTTSSPRRSSVATSAVNLSISNNAIMSTTSHQLQATAKQRALIELDRQRMLVLQQQSPNLFVGP